MIGAVFLAFGIILTVITGAALDWYPSRVGGLAYWLDDHLYQPILGVLRAVPHTLELAGLLYVFAIALSFAGYLLAGRAALRSGVGTQRHLVKIVAVQIAISLWLAVQPYISSQDIFSYAFYTHIFVWYRDNPLVAVPRDYPFDPLFSAIFWKDQPSNYGPLWTYLSALAPLIAGANVGLTLLILKLICIVPAVVGTLLLWSVLEKLRPERRLLGTLLFAWNPLLLIETAEAGHNDVVMASLLIASLWFWGRRQRTASMGALALAALVKYLAIAIVPLYLIAWWRETGESPLRILTRSALVGLTLCVVGFAPLFAGMETFGVLGFGSNPLAYTNSPLELVFREARLAFGESSQLADLPMHYDGHWIGSTSQAIMWSAPDDQRGTGIALPIDTPLLVVEPEVGSWVRVYEPKLGRFGFIRASQSRPIPAPATSVVPGTKAAVMAGISQDPVAKKANTLVRLLSLVLFLPWYLVCLWRAGRDALQPTALPCLVTSVLIVYLLAVQSWFWPWYLLWVLPFAVVVPESAFAVVFFAMTATTGLLNAQPSVNPPPFLEFLYGSRVLLIYGLPVAIGIWWARRSRVDSASGRISLAGSFPRWGEARQRLDSLRNHAYRLFGLAVVSRRRSPGAWVATFILLLVIVGVGRASIHRPDQRPVVIAWERAYDEALRNYSAGDYRATVDELSKVLAAVPGERSVIQLRIAANLELGRYGQTIPDLTTLIQADPSNADLRLERGIMYERIQRADRALVDFEEVMVLAPTNPSGYEWAGLVNYERGHFGPATRQLNRALSLSPHDGKIARELAAVMASENRLPDALALYDAAIQLNPIDARAYADRAAVLRHVGADSATIPDLQQVLVLTDDVQQQQWAVRLLGTITGTESHPDGATG